MGDVAAMQAFGNELIPRGRFTSAEFVALEYERLWPRVWQVACRLEEIPNPGDFVEYSIGDHSAFVTRTASGAVRAFHNTCIHRGTRLASGCGSFRGEIRCPFHGWRWDLDGANTYVQDPHEFPPATPDELRLRDVQVGEYGGFVFVNFDPDAPSLRAYLEDIPDWLDPYRPERMVFTSRKTTIVDANWKVVVDAFNEGYHIPAVHPEILKWKDDAALEYTPLHTHTRYGGGGWPMPSPRLGIPPEEVDEQEILLAKVDDLVDNLPGYIGPSEAEALRAQVRALPNGMTAGDFYLKRRRDGAAARGLDWSHLSDEQVLGGDDLLVFPNFIGPVVAGGFFAYRVRPNGLDPDTCIFDLWTLEEQPAGAPARPLPERQVFPNWRDHDWGLIVDQDFRNFDGIQKGLRNPGGPGLRWNRRQESCVRRFHEVLDRYLFDAPT